VTVDEEGIPEARADQWLVEVQRREAEATTLLSARLSSEIAGRGDQEQQSP